MNNTKIYEILLNIVQNPFVARNYRNLSTHFDKLGRAEEAIAFGELANNLKKNEPADDTHSGEQ